MIERELNLYVIAPRQTSLSRRRIDEMVDNFDVSKYTNPFVLKIDDRFVVIDGHHRCYCQYKRGKRTLPVQVVQDEDDFQVARAHASLAKSIDEFVEQYVQVNLPFCQKNRIRYIPDLRDHIW